MALFLMLCPRNCNVVAYSSALENPLDLHDKQAANGLPMLPQIQLIMDDILLHEPSACCGTLLHPARHLAHMGHQCSLITS